MKLVIDHWPFFFTVIMSLAILYGATRPHQ